MDLSDAIRSTMHAVLFPEGYVSISAIQRKHRLKWRDASDMLSALASSGWLNGLELSPFLKEDFSRGNERITPNREIMDAIADFKSRDALTSNEEQIFTSGFHAGRREREKQGLAKRSHISNSDPLTAAALETARNLVAAIDDPHTSLAQVVRWSNQLALELRALGYESGANLNDELAPNEIRGAEPPIS